MGSAYICTFRPSAFRKSFISYCGIPSWQCHSFSSLQFVRQKNSWLPTASKIHPYSARKSSHNGHQNRTHSCRYLSDSMSRIPWYMHSEILPSDGFLLQKHPYSAKRKLRTVADRFHIFTAAVILETLFNTYILLLPILNSARKESSNWLSR